MATFRIPVEETFSFQRPVLDKDLETAPGSPSKGQRYIVKVAGGGWSGGFAKDIAWYDGAAWKFDTPAAGWLTWVVDEAKFYVFSGGIWVEEAGQGDMLKSVYDQDDDGIVDKSASVDDGTSGNSSTAVEVRGAVDNSHVQGTDLGLDTGGSNPVTAAQAKEAFDSRGIYDGTLGCILMELS